LGSDRLDDRLVVGFGNARTVVDARLKDGVIVERLSVSGVWEHVVSDFVVVGDNDDEDRDALADEVISTVTIAPCECDML
jgi:hypothetical protein